MNYKILIISILVLMASKQLLFGNVQIQEDTLYVPEFENPPVIDGSGNDDCWNEVRWQVIDQVWIPLNAYVDSSDFYGRFKIAWSSKTNLLYFLCEVNDDIWVDGYVFDQPPDVYKFDLIEIFFDEDKSGGYHIFDYYDDKGRPVPYNSENAFAYHIAVTIPTEGQVVRDFIVVDGDGTSFFDNKNVNYAGHFDSLAVIRTGHVTTWEMSLMVYDSSYNTNPSSARVTLKEGKVSGVALAYCDDDTPEHIERQNFFGSVAADMGHLDNNGDFNNTWINADQYGAMKLVKELPAPIQTEVQTNNLHRNITKFYPNPVINRLNLNLGTEIQGESIIYLYNFAGVVIFNHKTFKENIGISMDCYPKGIYYISIANKVNTEVIKFIKL